MFGYSEKIGKWRIRGGYFLNTNKGLNMQFQNTDAAGLHPYWTGKMNQWGSYNCPNGCKTSNGNPKTIKPKVVVSTAKGNQGRTFASCSTQYGGCGLFCFTDEEPSDQALSKRQQGSAKRNRSDADGNFTTNNAAMPSNNEKLLADLSAKLDALDAKVSQLLGNRTGTACADGYVSNQ
jgi:hypothetical protein